MDYENVCSWTNTFDLITNRISIINQTLGARYDAAMDNPCVLVSKRGNYQVNVCGVCFASFSSYDLLETYDALQRLDALSDGLWYLMRSPEYTNYQLTTVNNALCNASL